MRESLTDHGTGCRMEKQRGPWSRVWLVTGLLAVGLWGAGLAEWFAWQETGFSVRAEAEDSPGSAAESLPRELHVPEGYTVELAAGPPLVKHPTLACLDDRGRLFVCDNAGVNMTAAELEEHLPNSIRLLEDTTGDGRFDRATVFADRMTFPMGGCWLDGSLYVASPPYIWKLTDTTGDGVADERIRLVGKFGYTGNAASIHGCFAGPEGRIYWCDGYHGHEFQDDAGEIQSQRGGSYLFSCEPDGSDVRIHCGGGMDNPVEVDFTAAGDMIGTVNIMYTRPRIDCLVNWQYGGVYPHREKILEEVQVTGDFLQPIHEFGHVAISGTMRYRSGALQPAWKDNFFATFFNLGKVVRLELTPAGSSYSVVQREFLSSPDRDFHPTDVLEDVDGSLLVVDTGGWFYRGCPTSQMSKPEIHGGIYRVRPAGIDSRQRPRANGDELNLETCSPEELLTLLTDERYRVRQRVLETLSRRATEVWRPLIEVAREGSAEQRLQATWALARIAGRWKRSGQTADSTEANEQVRAALRERLRDRDATIRQAACWIQLTYPDPPAGPWLVDLLQDEFPAVRRVAAAALGRNGEQSSVPALLTALPQAIDRDLEHALLYALIELDAPAETQRGLTSSDPAVRRGSLLVLDQLKSAPLTAPRLAEALQDKAPDVRLAAFTILRRRRGETEFLQQVTTHVLPRLTAPQGIGTDSEQAELLVVLSRDERLAPTIAQNLEYAPQPSDLTLTLLQRLGRELGLELHTAWLKPLEVWLTTGETVHLERILPILQGARSHPFDAQLEQIATDGQLSRELRVRLLQTRLSSRGKVAPEAFALLMDMLEEPVNSTEMGQAASLLGNAPLTKPQLLELAPLLESVNASALRELVRAYQRSGDREVAAAFFPALARSRFLTTIPPQELSDIIIRYPADSREPGNVLLDQLKRQEQEKLDRIDRVVPLLTEGNAARGRDLFFAERTKCAACHRVGAEGRAVGPDLSAIGANRAPQDLLESILFPSATIVRDYDAYTVVLADGRVLTGLISRETSDFVELQQATGEREQIPREEIEELVTSNVSLMPSGLEKEISDQELADLVAYLITLREAAISQTEP